MRAIRSVLTASVVLLASFAFPHHAPVVTAQTSPRPDCSGSAVASPTPGHYAGPWHSEGDYHFIAEFPAFNGHPAATRNIEMKIVIDGSLDATVDPNGKITGTATGNLQAPIYHDGQQDISSGYGTIKAQVTGVFVASGSLILLSHPVLDIHWGTFGGHAVETYPVLPDFTLSVTAMDCVSSQGTSSEQDFPAMNITNDSTGQLARAPGIGTATGTWMITSDEAGQFRDLSQRVDSFIARSNTLLADRSTAITPSWMSREIMQPLRDLEVGISGHPDLARCLLNRLGAWEASALPDLVHRSQVAAATENVVSLRQAGDLLRASTFLSDDCSLGNNGVADAVMQSEQRGLDHAIAAREWADAVLWIRELLLLGGTDQGANVQTEVNANLHGLLAGTSNAPMRLEVQRVAYALGDDTDARVGSSTRRESRSPDSLPWKPQKPGHGKHKRTRRHPRPAPKPTPTPLPSPTATATPTALPLTLDQRLSAGLSSITVQHDSSANPLFSWQPINGADRYLVAVIDGRTSHLVWSWSGKSSSVRYGDASLEGATAGADETWPAGLDTGKYTWSVIALDAQGKLIGLKLRARG